MMAVSKSILESNYRYVTRKLKQNGCLDYFETQFLLVIAEDKRKEIMDTGKIDWTYASAYFPIDILRDYEDKIIWSAISCNPTLSFEWYKKHFTEINFEVYKNAVRTKIHNEEYKKISAFHKRYADLM